LEAYFHGNLSTFKLKKNKAYPKLLNKLTKRNHSTHTVVTVVMAHAAIAFWHHFHHWISMDAQKDLLVGLLGNNPDQIGPRASLRTSWNLIRQHYFQSSSETEIP
jgi:hypothetical protein